MAMTEDLYRVLGVPRGADDETVRRQYRRKARKHHPDTGGNDEDFNRVHRAFVVLSDPGKRSRYDKSGDIDEENVGMTPEQEAMAAIRQNLHAVLGEIVQKGGEILEHNLVHLIRSRFKSQAAEIPKNIHRLKRARTSLTEAATRFVGTPGEVNLLVTMVNAEMAIIDSDLAKLEKDRATVTRAIEIVEHYDFKADIAQVFVKAWGGAGAWGFASSS